MGIVHHFNHGTPFNVPSPQWPRRGVLATTSPPVQIVLFFPTGSAGSEPVGGWFSHPSSASSLDSRRHELYYSAASKLNHLRDPHDPGQLNKANPTSPISEAKKETSVYRVRSRSVSCKLWFEFVSAAVVTGVPGTSIQGPVQ